MLDLVFALDGSRPLTSTQFDKYKEAILNMLGKYTISDQETHVGLIEFSSSVRLVSRLDKNNKVKYIKNMLSSLQPSGGTSRLTDEVLRVASDRVFSVKDGGRPGASKALVILTHGKSSGDTSPVDAAKPLKEAGVNVFVIGIGGNVDPDETKGVATSHRHVIPVDNPDKAPDAIDSVVETLTKDLKKSKTCCRCCRCCCC